MPVDECADGTATCDVNATCTDLPDGYSCTCNAGFQGDGHTCTDIDPCGDGTAMCDANATCTNLADGYDCTCNAGYQGDGSTCTDVDECMAGTSNCDPNATCTNTMGSFTCACPAGTNDVNGDGTSCVVAGQGCAAAIMVDPNSLPVTLTGDTSLASGHYGFSAGACPGVTGASGGGANDVAYSFTPATSGSYTFTLTGNNGFDTALYVVTDCSNVDGSCVAAVDNACSGCAEGLTTTLTAGTTYFVVVDGSTTSQAGSYSLAIKMAKSFNNPVQIDVSALLVDDTVVNNGAGALDTIQAAIDGSGYDLITQSAAQQLHAGTVYALPDDATIAADTNHPTLHLWWNNANDGPNSRIVKTGGTFTMPVPADTYTQLQVYAVSTEGSSSMQFTLNYSDGTSDVKNVTFGDWYNDPAGAGTFFVLNGLDRIGSPPSSATYEAAHDPAMAGANLNPNTAKTLTSVVVNHLTSAGWFVFYGAAAW